MRNSLYSMGEGGAERTHAQRRWYTDRTGDGWLAWGRGRLDLTVYVLLRRCQGCCCCPSCASCWGGGGGGGDDEALQPAPRKGKHLSRTSTCKLEHAPEPSCTRESPPSRRRAGSGKDSQAGGPDVGTAQVRHRDDDDDIHQSSRRARTQTRVLLLVAPPARLGAGYKCDDGGGGGNACDRHVVEGELTDRPVGVAQRPWVVFALWW